MSHHYGTDQGILDFNMYSGSIHPTTSASEGFMTLGDYTSNDSPSPANPSPSPPSAGSRKSSPGRYRSAGLTQQQVNKKRQRATLEQLSVLEETFSVNPTPNSKIRQALAQTIQMTERSVQIWFQNRRAKVKLLQRRGVEDDSEKTGRPSLLRSHSYHPMSGSVTQQSSYLVPFAAANSRVVITQLSCKTLTIGTWHRTAQTSMDLICYFSVSDHLFTYYINSNSTGYKLEYPVSALSAISLQPIRQTQLNVRRLGKATLVLCEPPIFYMEVPSAGGWQRCEDFTQDLQGSNVLQHIITGPLEMLKQQFQELTLADSRISSLMHIEEESPPLFPPFGLQNHHPLRYVRRHRSQSLPLPEGTMPNLLFDTEDPLDVVIPAGSTLAESENFIATPLDGNAFGGYAAGMVDASQMNLLPPRIWEGYEGQPFNIIPTSFPQQLLGGE